MVVTILTTDFKLISTKLGKRFMEDADLVRLCQKGDMSAFEQLFHKHHKRIYNVAYRITNSREDAQDLTQDIFLKAYQNMGKFKFKSEFSTWLYRLAVNTCLDEIRRKKPSNVISITDSSSDEALSQTDGYTPEDHAIKKDRERQIWKAINTLKEKERAIIVLKDIEGLSYKEIAEVFKCSLGRVKSRLHEARQKLKEALETETDLWDKV
jgi:RNA polymerase sigma-70 factor (ECF subfamily)